VSHPNDFRFTSTSLQNVCDFADLAHKARFARALEDGASRYPVQRTLRGAARADLEILFDDLALTPAFIDRFLDASETAVVVQGAPGTGKTRLIRAILGEMSRRRSERAQPPYTGDIKSLESDEIFVKFITAWGDAFVVEDASRARKTTRTCTAFSQLPTESSVRREARSFF
jgi:Cdc6-like AAA superfamily ATPase